jgi:hypothetical protein
MKICGINIIWFQLDSWFIFDTTKNNFIGCFSYFSKNKILPIYTTLHLVYYYKLELKQNKKCSENIRPP